MELGRLHRLAQPGEGGVATMASILSGLRGWLAEFKLPPTEIEEAVQPFLIAARASTGEPAGLTLEAFQKAAEACPVRAHCGTHLGRPAMGPPGRRCLV